MALFLEIDFFDKAPPPNGYMAAYRQYSFSVRKDKMNVRQRDAKLSELAWEWQPLEPNEYIACCEWTHYYHFTKKRWFETKEEAKAFKNQQGMSGIYDCEKDTVWLGNKLDIDKRVQY